MSSPELGFQSLTASLGQLQESLKRISPGIEAGDTHLERAVTDLNAREFIKEFLSPYNPEDSLEYMAKELVTLKRGEELQASRHVVQELITKPPLRQILGEFVRNNYDLKSSLEEREELLGPFGINKTLSFLSWEKVRDLVKVDYQVLKSFVGSVEKTQEIESESSLFRKLREFGLIATQEETYKASKDMVEIMENFGEAKLHIRYDYFDTVKGVQHLRFDPSERWKEILKWYLHTGKVRFDKILSYGLAYLFPGRKERLCMETLEFLIKQNWPFIEKILEYRRQMDFFSGAARYVEKIKLTGVPLTFPSLSEEGEILIKELYNPCLLLQRGIKEKKDIVPNDVESYPEENVTIITAPNNTGKTVYVKVIGLACALYQNGFPIPAEEAQLPELDDLYTHFVHPEDIKLGEGSYLDELGRIKELFQNATSRTLIIIDEPIRGSSPEDSEEMTLRFIKGFVELKAPTFLTTHFHSVAAKVDSWNGVRNLQTGVMLDGKELKPTYKIKPGKAGKSYGIEIAGKFGLTEEDILRMIRKI